MAFRQGWLRKEWVRVEMRWDGGRIEPGWEWGFGDEMGGWGGAVLRTRFRMRLKWGWLNKGWAD